MPDDNVIRNLEAQAAQKRKHATFFTWHDRSAEGKGVAEAGIVNELLTAMEAEQRRDYRNLGPSGDQWPDVWLQDSTGRQVPCEVAELVDQAALPAGDARPQVLAELAETAPGDPRTQRDAKLRREVRSAVGFGYPFGRVLPQRRQRGFCAFTDPF